MIDVSNIHLFFAEQADSSRRVGSFLYCYCDKKIRSLIDKKFKCMHLNIRVIM